MNGFLIINKDLGYTSRDVVNSVSKIFNTKKVGHSGTLDPMATGVLVIGIGNALKMMELTTMHDKEYIAQITLGIETDTLDMDGNILRDESCFIDENKIIDCVKSFNKTYLQEVPKYSAVKVNGKKLYEYARSNTDVLLPKKEVTISHIEIVDNKINYVDGKIIFSIKCTVSKGTYIRSLVRDIGNLLNVPAVMSGLVRTRSGIFELKDAKTLDDIKKGNYELISITKAFPDIKKCVVNDEIAFKIKNGVTICNLFKEKMAFIIDKDNNLLALYENINDKCRVYKMFV